jgi:hypothetical protein
VNCRRLSITIIPILFSVAAYAANPFLDAANDQPISAKFRGTEWSEDIGGARDPSDWQSGDNAYRKNAVGHDFQN